MRFIFESDDASLLLYEYDSMRFGFGCAMSTSLKSFEAFLFLSRQVTAIFFRCGLIGEIEISLIIWDRKK